MIVSLVLFLFISVLSDLGSAIARNTTVEREYVSVGVVVDYGRWAGTMGLSCIQMAVSDFYASKGNNQYKTRLLIHSRDSKADVIGAASAGKLLINLFSSFLFRIMRDILFFRFFFLFFVFFLCGFFPSVV